MNTAPSLEFFTDNLPPESLMIEYEIDRPKPVPFPTSFVVKKGSKIRWIWLFGMPPAESATVS